MYMFIKIIELSIQYPQDCMKGKRPQLKLLDIDILIQNLYWVILDTGMPKTVAYNTRLIVVLGVLRLLVDAGREGRGSFKH